MIRINLLPFRAARKRENIKRQISLYIASVCVTLALMVVLFMNFNGKLSELKGKEGRLNKELAGYQKELDEIKRLNKKIKEVNKKLDVIKDLERGKTGPVLLLSDIADAVPKDKLWLKSLSEKNGNLSLSGIAMDNETVSVFMKNLKKTQQIIDVPKLDVTKDKTLPQFRLTVSEFVLKCKTYAAEKKKKSTSKKKKKKKK